MPCLYCNVWAKLLVVVPTQELNSCQATWWGSPEGTVQLKKPPGASSPAPSSLASNERAESNDPTTSSKVGPTSVGGGCETNHGLGSYRAATWSGGGAPGSSPRGECGGADQSDAGSAGSPRGECGGVDQSDAGSAAISHDGPIRCRKRGDFS
eukprot:1186803-Prorocentrum_minimum.AAC.1